MGLAQAAPDPAGVVRANVQHNAEDVKVEVFGGALAVETVGVGESYLVVRNQAGTTVEKVPLQFRGPANKVYQVDTTVAGRTATLTPSKAAVAAYAGARNEAARAIRGPRNKQERDDEALSRMTQEMAAAMTLSSIIGLSIGLVIGVVAGIVLGCFVSLCVAAIPFAIAGGGLGSILGVVLGGGGGAVVAFQKYLDTVNSPFKPQYDKNGPGAPVKPKKKN